MKKVSDPLWSTRIGLKFEVMIPFILLDGAGGTAGAFGQSLIAAMFVAVLNTSSEQLICSVPTRRSRFLVSIVSGVISVAIYSGLIIWWDAHKALRDPIAYYGAGRTLLVIGVFVFLVRLVCMVADGPPSRGDGSVNSKEKKTAELG
jgi:hypothetical protein